MDRRWPAADRVSALVESSSPPMCPPAGSWAIKSRPSVGAMPRSYQATPVILGGGGRHGKSRSDQRRPTGEERVSPPPAENQTDERDDTER